MVDSLRREIDDVDDIWSIFITIIKNSNLFIYIY